MMMGFLFRVLRTDICKWAKRWTLTMEGKESFACFMSLFIS